MVFSWVSEKMIALGPHGLLFGMKYYISLLNLFPKLLFNTATSIYFTPSNIKCIPYTHCIFSVVALGFQSGLGIILCQWVPSSDDQAMFYATSFIWGTTSASWEFLILCKFLTSIVQYYITENLFYIYIIIKYNIVIIINFFITF